MASTTISPGIPGIPPIMEIPTDENYPYISPYWGIGGISYISLMCLSCLVLIFFMFFMIYMMDSMHRLAQK